MWARRSASARSNSVRRRTTTWRWRTYWSISRAQVEDLRPLVDQRQHDGAEGGLERRVHEQLVQDHLGVGVLLELDHDAHAVAVGLVAQVADPRHLPRAPGRRSSRAARDLLTWNGISVATRLMRPARPSSTCTRARILIRPRPVQVAVADALRAVDDAAGREVRARDDLEQVGGVASGWSIT